MLRHHGVPAQPVVPGARFMVWRRTLGAFIRRSMADDGADSVILGCTEFGLLLTPDDIAAPVFDTAQLHAAAGISFALA